MDADSAGFLATIQTGLADVDGVSYKSFDIPAGIDGIIVTIEQGTGPNADNCHLAGFAFD